MPTDKDIRVEGRDDAKVWANELARIAYRSEYLLSLQSCTNPPQPTLPTNKGQAASQPIMVSSSNTTPAAKSFYAATTTKAGSEWTMVNKKGMGTHWPWWPISTLTRGRAKQPYSIDKLSACWTTRGNIIAHMQAIFGAQLNNKMMKPQLIVTYRQLTPEQCRTEWLACTSMLHIHNWLDCLPEIRHRSHQLCPPVQQQPPPLGLTYPNCPPATLIQTETPPYSCGGTMECGTHLQLHANLCRQSEEWPCPQLQGSPPQEIL